jgi:5-methylcytosine-specific restriction endonuclease McrA
MRKNSPNLPRVILIWIMKLIWNLVVCLWERRRNPMPRVRPGELPTQEQLDAFYLTPQWSRLSYRTKKRYGWCCMCCGATPPIKIVTDHIKSLRYHWDLGLDPNNLQVLCDPCNQRKGARDATDYRASWERGVRPLP